MTDEREDALDAMDWLLSRFEEDEAVAYAEVGGVYAEKTDAVVTHEGPRERVSFVESGVWLRTFADGAADYRYTTSLDEESLEDEAERAVRGGQMLAQSDPARFDAHTTHRAVHDGWADESIGAVDVDEKVAAVEDGLAAADDLDLRRVWVNYADAHVEETVGNTTGSTVRTTLDRAQVTCSLHLEDGPKVRRHAGSTEGAAFLDELPDVFESAAADARALSTASVADAPTGETSVALSPRAAGQLFHFVSHYLEADTGYMGMSPYAVGDRIAPDGLDIEDGVRAGSWAARAYDSEVRPTTPVRLVSDGEVERLLHNTASAAEEGAHPAGSAVPSLGYGQPPRIHARHLDVAAGEADEETLRADADVYVERFGEPWFRDEFERVQRAGVFPASVLYAKDIDRKTEERPDCGSAEFPVAEGYRLEDGERAGRVEGLSLDYDPGVLRTLSAFGAARETVTGVCEKHKSHLPFAVTAPGVQLEATLKTEA
ncbi:metallopeptidase TldD-related protein [Halogeometricum sp. S1BR25-6]|uniref:Metallopeptidase TldD-related protein n=1 Tax=Halogeometricum salsisoli TaxID=2950536 RepID=A0ABU2GH05_9EURY|nr:metallopeptidase TldD-related protein [Halogeometricum sp. S1BR25-6]MDS0300080.1 metallopeptidase TldD-related protein [Halogeometricum sp. S1BR25-6]